MKNIIAVVQNYLVDLLNAKMFSNICPQVLCGSGYTICSNTAMAPSNFCTILSFLRLRNFLRTDNGIDSYKVCTVQICALGSLSHLLV